MPTTTAGVTGRGAARRAAIVAAAAELFSRNGYAAVGMDSIGAAAGVTGPAIYRHFDSKAAVLAAVFDRIIDTVVTRPAPAAEDPAPAADDPTGPTGNAAERLTDAVRTYADGVAASRTVMAVFVREVHHLPDRESAQLMQRQRTLVHRWRELVAELHPDWPEQRVRTAVHAAFGLLNAVGTFTSPLTDAELAEQLTALTLAALAG
ncbi:TetR/AcrR family transcriptional regulator [Nakamurella lactea]|uniref:TetR/AcrR family transcriptional regulator n=1 Tax=Nakamurella lactea TaxID=459515 RepID=UPI00041462B3|nr:TetR/AcrR family transcriptional regulator [Nakamurella lactea]